MDIKKFISEKKIALLVTAGVLVVVATAGALYLNSGTLFKGLLGELTVQTPLNPAMSKMLTPITEIGVSNVWLSPTTLDLSAANPSITFNYAFLKDVNIPKVSSMISIYVLPKGDSDFNHAVKKWDNISPDNGKYNSVSWDVLLMQKLKSGDSYHFETYYSFPPQIVSSPDFQVVKSALFPLSAGCTASSTSIKQGDTVTFTIITIGGTNPLKFEYTDPTKGLLPSKSNTFTYTFNTPGLGQIIKVTASDSAIPAASAVGTCNPVDVAPTKPALKNFFVTCTSTPTMSADSDTPVTWTVASNNPNNPLPNGTNYTWSGDFGNLKPSNSPTFKTNYTNNGQIPLSQGVSVSLKNDPDYAPENGVSCGSISIPSSDDPTIQNVIATPATIVLGQDALKVTVNTVGMSGKDDVKLQFDLAPGGILDKPDQIIHGVDNTNTYSFNFDSKFLAAMSVGPHTYRVGTFTNNGQDTNDEKEGNFKVDAQVPGMPTIVSATNPSAPIVLGKDNLQVTVKTTNMSDQYKLNLQIDGYQAAVPENQSNQTISGSNNNNSYIFTFDGKALDDNNNLDYITVDKHTYNVFLRDNNGKQITTAPTGYFTTVDQVPGIPTIVSATAPSAQIVLGKDNLQVTVKTTNMSDQYKLNLQIDGYQAAGNQSNQTISGSNNNDIYNFKFDGKALDDNNNLNYISADKHIYNVFLLDNNGKQITTAPTGYFTTVDQVPGNPNPNPNATPTASNVQITPSPFDIKGGSATATITFDVADADPNAAPSNATLYVKKGGNDTKTYSNVAWGTQSQVSRTWDGKDNNGNLVQPGTYRLELWASGGQITDQKDFVVQDSSQVGPNCSGSGCPNPNPNPPQQPTPGCAGYYDVPANSTACLALQYAKDQGRMTGKPDGNFDPNAYLQRDQVLKVLNGGDVTVKYCNGVKPFPDVTSTQWAYELTCMEKQIGTITGYLDTGLYLPANAVTRAEFAAMVTRMLHIHATLDASINFSDVPTDVWYSRFAASFYKYGLYSGIVSGTAMEANAPLTRLQVAQVMYQLHVLGLISN